MTETYDRCAGTPLVIHWKLLRHLFFTWEIETDALEPLIRPELELVEIRPGISLLSIGVLESVAQQFGPSSPVFHEAVVVAHVHPELSLDMPVPRFTFASLSVYSDSPEFVDRGARALFTPTELVPSLSVTFQPDGLGAEVADDRGPICSVYNTHPAPDFAPYEVYGQHFTERSGLHVGAWEWNGIRFEHMQRGAAGELHPHPFFKGLDLRRVRGCYRQMMAQPGEVSHERFFAMQPLPGVSAATAPGSARR